MSDRNFIANAFVPSKEIADPQRFAGRRSAVRHLAEALHEDGSLIVIYGPRGIGKSSLALQGSRIAQGDVELLSQFEYEELALTGEHRFITLYVTCSDETKNLKGIQQLMLNALTSLKHRLDAEAPGAGRVLVDRKTRRKVSFKIFEAETTKSYDEQIKELDLSSFSLAEKIERLSETLTDVFDQPVLFILDEVDRVASTKGLASYLKSYSSDHLRFALVGIGHTVEDLLEDHESIGRPLQPVRLGVMTRTELMSIVERTQAYLAEDDHFFEFTESAQNEIARLAGGFPWFVHVVGKEILLAAYDEGRSGIEKSHVTALLREGNIWGRLAPVLEARYQRAVKDSWQRECVLRLLAEWTDESIPTSEIYPKARALGVSNPSTYIGHLTKETCGRAVRKISRQNQYAFVDEMFKVYVRMRRSTYANVDTRTRAAMK
ncbi:ATP-binding protein [Demequina sp. SYSU T00039]|uniref:ATP-binding protein n=1 Tax=Demequina lignilytica TaxID=3051663 RepID=A0AAW7M7Y1_9MICO|nr:ATP-binding protein [Demequina sp. SYSU T00039]MDN4486576.1 ATP-binding protein [Demequina sp. SYSU T00039]